MASAWTGGGGSAAAISAPAELASDKPAIKTMPEKTVALQTVDSGLGRITPSMDEAGRSFGYQPLTMLRKVHIPMLQGSLLTAILLVFVDVLKELPATLILRPFNFNTLAVRAYELASDERLAEAAPAALAIVVAGIVPVILLSRTITRSRQTASHLNDASAQEN